MHFMQIESVLQTKNRSEPAKNRFSVALLHTAVFILCSFSPISFLVKRIISDRKLMKVDTEHTL